MYDLYEIYITFCTGSQPGNSDADIRVHLVLPTLFLGSSLTQPICGIQYLLIKVSNII